LYSPSIIWYISGKVRIVSSLKYIKIPLSIFKIDKTCLYYSQEFSISFSFTKNFIYDKICNELKFSRRKKWSE
jgi:hypothetical protein